MKLIKLFALFSILLLTSNLYSMKYARVVDGIKQYIGRVVKLKGTIQQTWRIKGTTEDVIKKLSKNPAIMIYSLRDEALI